jgi:mannose-6-phosphate isomerase-like protein (cupin superfamily)
MRRQAAVVLIAVGLVGGFVALGPHLGAQGEGRGRGEGQTVILEKAPLDHAISIPKAKLAQYLQDMDAKKLQTLRMIEGGKFNVNIRRIRNAETALVHPKTVDVWVVLDGGGTLTTGGKIENGKIVGGESHALKVGDVEFIPANLPHGVSGVNGNITWLNVRWDTDWPADAKLGAGNAPPAAGAAAPAGRGRGLMVKEYAQTDHSVAIPLEKLDAYRQEMEAANAGTLRMIEGGHFNVNIRRIKAPSTEIHPTTIDTWVVLEGGGTANTGFELKDGKMVPGTGVNQKVTVGDVMFIPSNFNHGYSAVDGVVAWLNIRWDDNYANAPAAK